jgi:hypothetical protein
MSATQLATKPPITKLSNKKPKKPNIDGDQRARDAADTLVSLAHSSTTGSSSAQSTPSTSPTTDLNNKKLIEILNENNKRQSGDYNYQTPTQACKMLQEILKTCSNSNSKTSISAQASNNLHTANESKRANSVSSSSLQSSDLEDSSQSSFNSTPKFANKKPNKNLADISNDMHSNSNSSTNTQQQYAHKRASSSENRVKYGPILVRPRAKAAPTLATGRRSKDEKVSASRPNLSSHVFAKSAALVLQLPADEEQKRQERRNRNKEAAAKCRRKREEVADTLQKVRKK